MSTLIALMFGVYAQLTCPQHLAPQLAGWLPPDVCAGLGRYNPTTQCEVQVERNLFQGDNYAPCLLTCARTQTPDGYPLCAESCGHRFGLRVSAVLSRYVCPVCLDSGAQLDAAAEVRAFVETVVMPVSIVPPVDGLFDCLARAHLERAIGELRTAQQEQRAEASCMTTYVNRATVPALGAVIQQWMADHSDMAFCAF